MACILCNPEWFYVSYDSDEGLEERDNHVATDTGNAYKPIIQMSSMQRQPEGKDVTIALSDKLQCRNQRLNHLEVQLSI